MAVYRIPARRLRQTKSLAWYAAAVVDTLTVQDAAVIAVGEISDLIQEHTLAVSDAAIVAAGDVEALTQEHNLVIADAAVVSVGETVNITQYGVSTLSQHSFRFRNDDGDEDAATWAAALNNNLSLAPDNVVRLRFLIDAGGDNAGTQFQLEYKKTTDAEWSVAA